MVGHSPRRALPGLARATAYEGSASGRPAPDGSRHDVQRGQPRPGEGVDLVVEVCGGETFDQSVAALRFGGRISLIGNLAGARTVIMSLWSVRDDDAQEWMEALYRARWLEDRDTACSVRSATLAVLDARRSQGRSLHPYYWAGFTAAGDWR